jgi:hypothetical protein
MPSLLPGESDANPTTTTVDVNAIVASLLAPLHASVLADLGMWTECELIQWIDAAVKRLARMAGLFAGRSIDTMTVAGTPTYALPSQSINTVHASYDRKPLRPASTGELAARDAQWQTRQAPPQRWYQDSLGLGAIGLCPVPTRAKALWTIYYGWPQTVDCAKSHTTIPLPRSLEPFLELYTLGEAYSKEGDGFAPDIAQAARAMAGLYSQVAVEYWGAAQ